MIFRFSFSMMSVKNDWNIDTTDNDDEKDSTEVGANPDFSSIVKSVHVFEYLQAILRGMSWLNTALLFPYLLRADEIQPFLLK